MKKRLVDLGSQSGILDIASYRKATPRHWRMQFAENLRELGVAANATERAVRGKSDTHLPDRIYRANQRGESTYLQSRARALHGDLRHSATPTPDPGTVKVLATRQAVDSGWRNVSLMLANEGYRELGLQAHRFVGERQPPLSERQMIAFATSAGARADADGTPCAIIPAQVHLLLTQDVALCSRRWSDRFIRRAPFSRRGVAAQSRLGWNLKHVRWSLHTERRIALYLRRAQHGNPDTVADGFMKHGCPESTCTRTFSTHRAEVLETPRCPGIPGNGQESLQSRSAPLNDGDQHRQTGDRL